MTEQDTAPDLGQSDGTNDETWEQRYKGLQRTLSKRDEELAALRAAAPAAPAAEAAPAAPAAPTISEAEQAELAEYRAAKAEAARVAAEQAEYERLQAVFEPEPPTPSRPNAAGGTVDDRVWAEQYERRAAKERASSGWPV